MGKLKMTTFRIEMRLNDGTSIITPFSGRVTDRTVAEFIANMNMSFNLDKCNGHISKAKGILIRINSARVIRQKTGQTVANYVAPMFEVI